MGNYLVSNNTKTPIPTHFFLRITRCKDVGQPITECNSDPKDLEVLSFIMPNYADYPCKKVMICATTLLLFVWIPRARFVLRNLTSRRLHPQRGSYAKWTI